MNLLQVFDLAEVEQVGTDFWDLWCHMMLILGAEAEKRDWRAVI